MTTYYGTYQVLNAEGLCHNEDVSSLVRQTVFIDRCIIFSFISSILQLLMYTFSHQTKKAKLHKIIFILLFLLFGFNFHIFSGILQSFFQMKPEPIFFVVASQIFFRIIIIINAHVNWIYIFSACLANFLFEGIFFWAIHHRSHSTVTFYMLVNSLIYLASTILAYYNELKSKKEYFLLRRINFDRDYLMNFLYYMSQGYFIANESELLFVNKSMDKIIRTSLNRQESRSSVIFNHEENPANIENAFFLTNRYASNVKLNTQDHLARIVENLTEINDNLPNEILSVFTRESGPKFSVKKGSFKFDNFFAAVKSSPVYNTFVGNSKFEFLGIVSLKGLNNEERVVTCKKSFAVMFRLISHEDGRDYLEFLFSDVTKIIQDERERAVSNCRSMYLSKIAHEFKNPLTSLIEISSSISDDAAPGSSKLLKKIVHKTEHSVAICHNMNYLLKDFAILTSLKPPCDCPFLSLCSNCKNQKFCNRCKTCSNCFDIQTESFDVSPVLSAQIASFSRLCDFENKFIIFDYESKETFLQSNKPFLESILFNILAHCYKRMFKGILTVSIKVSKDSVTFNVSDSGPKLDLDYINALMESERIEEQEGQYSELFFEKFNRHFHIYIVICLIRRIGSTLFIESSQSKSNYSFTVDNLPIFPVTQRKVTRVSMRTSELDDTASRNSPITVKKDFPMNFLYEDFDLNGINNSSRSQMVSIAEEPSIASSDPDLDCQMLQEGLRRNSKRSEDYVHVNAKPNHQKKIKVLLVDDENLVRSGLKRYFSKIAQSQHREIECDEAEDPFIAMNLIYKNNLQNIAYDLVITDECMPHMKGSSFIKMMKALQEEGNLYKLPFISHTAYDSPEKRKLLMESGADLIISKPCDYSTFKDTVKNYLP